MTTREIIDKCMKDTDEVRRNAATYEVRALTGIAQAILAMASAVADQKESQR